MLVYITDNEYCVFAEEMAAASLDQNFKEELSAIEQCVFSTDSSDCDICKR